MVLQPGLAATTPSISTVIELPALVTKLAKSTRLPGSLPVFTTSTRLPVFFKFLPVLGIPISKK